MQITETLNEGLKRELKITVGAAELGGKLDERLNELKDQVQLKGFRPGKVPINHLKKVYGKQAMAEVVEKTVDETSQAALAERNESPAYRPEVSFDEAKDMQPVLDGAEDLEFLMVYEVVPNFEIDDLSNLKFEKLVSEVGDADIEEAMETITAQMKDFEPKGKTAKAAEGDQVVIDFVGKIDGEEFEGGSAEAAPLELGSNSFIPGFEDQLVGAKIGDEKTIDVTFPADYPKEDLANKPAQFDVVVKEVNKPKAAELNDEVAQKMGLENLEALREAVREQAQGDFTNASSTKLKRAVLDTLDEKYKLDLPQRLVDGEFDNIWQAVMTDLEQNKRTFEDEETTEDEARKEYLEIAERRVRLGLVLGKIGDAAGVQITDDELQAALIERVRQFPGQEQQVYQFYRDNPNAMLELRGPIFEQKVVDHIIELAEVSEKKVSRDELFHDPDEHDHDHDHDHKEEKKPVKKAAAKKAPAKKAAAKKPATKKAAAAEKKPAAKKAPAKKAPAKKAATKKKD
ncbi:MAG: trigger factor [Hyphomicrobiales bacterium]